MKSVAGVVAPSFRVWPVALLAALLLLLGLTIAAVQSLRVECRPNYLLAGPGQILMAGDQQALLVDGTKTCQAKRGQLQAPIPEWLARVL